MPSSPSVQSKCLSIDNGRVCVCVCVMFLCAQQHQPGIADRFDLWAQAARSHVAYPLVSLLYIYIYSGYLRLKSISARSCRERSMMCGRLVILYTSRTLLVYSPLFYFYFVFRILSFLFLLRRHKSMGPTGRKRPSALLFLLGGVGFFLKTMDGRWRALILVHYSPIIKEQSVGGKETKKTSGAGQQQASS